MIRDVRLEGPTQVDLRLWEPVDLIQPNAAPSEFDLINFLPGNYDLVRFTLEPLEGFMPGPSGRKVSTFICGTVDGVYFEYRDDTYDNIEMPRNIPMQVAPGDLELLVAQFDVQSWFIGVDFTVLTSAADGVVYIDEAHHPDLQHSIRQRIKASIDALRGE